MAQPTRILFIDTSTFERHLFHFAGPLLQAVAVHGSQGRLCLVVPSIIEREVSHRIRERVGEATHAIRTKASILRNVHDHSVSGLFEVLDDDEIAGTIEEAWRSYLSHNWVSRLPNSVAAIDSILDDYLACKPPFGQGHKRCEFPDAIALHSIQCSDQCKGRTVNVVTEDQDVKAYCLARPDRKHWESLEAFLKELSAAQRNEEEAKAVLDQVALVSQELCERFRELAKGLQIDTDEPSYLVTDFHVLEVQHISSELLEVGESIVVSLDFEVSVRLEIEGTDHYLDPDHRPSEAFSDERKLKLPASLAITKLDLAKRDISDAQLDLDVSRIRISMDENPKWESLINRATTACE